MNMTKRRKSQIVMLEHSRAKVELLRKYLEKYLNIIANDGFTQRIDIFDLFCREGIYENGGNGSPIEMLKVVSELYVNNKAKIKNIPKVNIFFNDRSRIKLQS